MSEWYPISSAPMDGSEVLSWDDRTQTVKAIHYHMCEEKWMYKDDNGICREWLNADVYWPMPYPPTK